MAKNLLIVESPSKSKTIEKYLGSDYKVLASYGHIRELPSKNGSVDPDNNFEAIYQIIGKSEKAVKEIESEVKKADNIYVATDPDREGEAIGWHVLEVLKQKKISLSQKNVKRITFNEITKQAILDALKAPRQIDENLVDAQQSRQFLDYLVGFNLSPVLWRKLPGSRSAGRVQSVALRLVVEREFEINDFKPQEYWTVEGVTSGNIKPELESFDGVKLEKFDISDNSKANEVIKKLRQINDYFVLDVQKKEVRRRPYPPFTTSTLQQDASTRLGFGAKKTMMVAQSLYESGYITYMRTDSPTISNDGISKIRKSIGAMFGLEYLSKSEIVYKSKAKNSQEAHEAIRPVDPSLKPGSIGSLGSDEARLYELIWRRSMASQASDSVFDSTKVLIGDKAEKNIFKINGSVLKFDGFLKIYNYSDQEDTILPNFEVNSRIDFSDFNGIQHFTQPPARYTEASLVKKLEEMGIGRPSTYASIISVIQEREYAELKQKRFYATKKGEIVTEFLKAFFPKYVEYDFTANLENDLDEISDGKIKKLSFLKSFWSGFKQNVDSVNEKRISDIIDSLRERLEYMLFEKNSEGLLVKTCPKCKSELTVKIGRFGPFGCCSSYPECKYIIKSGVGGDSSSVDGVDPLKPVYTDGSGLEFYVKKGPYGAYIEYERESVKKRVSIPKGVKPEDLTGDMIEKLINLPRVVGVYPETKKEIKAGIGIYGPYLLYDARYYKLPSLDLVFDIGINHAVDIISSAGEKVARSVKSSKKTVASKTSASKAKVSKSSSSDSKASLSDNSSISASGKKKVAAKKATTSSGSSRVRSKKKQDGEG